MKDFIRSIFWLLGPTFVVANAERPVDQYGTFEAVVLLFTIVLAYYLSSCGGYERTGTSVEFVRTTTIFSLFAAILVWGAQTNGLLFQNIDGAVTSILILNVGIGGSLLWRSRCNTGHRPSSLKGILKRGCVSVVVISIFSLTSVTILSSTSARSYVSSLLLVFLSSIPILLWAMIAGLQNVDTSKTGVLFGSSYLILLFVLSPDVGIASLPNSTSVLLIYVLGLALVILTKGPDRS